MKIKFLIAVMLYASFCCAQTFNLVGRVLTEEGIPVEGIKVSITGIDEDTATSSGQFTIAIPASSAIRPGDKVTCFLQETGKPMIEYSIIIPKKPLIDPVIIRLKPDIAKKTALPDKGLTFSVANYYDEPYGEAFYKETNEIVKVRCLPEYYHELHMSPSVNNSILSRVDDIVKEGYRVILSNPDPEKIIISDVRMIISGYQPLPDRYIVNWAPKGMKKAITVDVTLNPESRTYKSFKKDEYLELVQDESQILLYDLKKGIAGIYTLEFEIDVLGKDGNYTKRMYPDKFRILLPDRENHKGVLLVNSLFEEELSDRLLNLDAAAYKKVAEASNPSSIYTSNNYSPVSLKNLSDQGLVKDLLKKKR